MTTSKPVLYFALLFVLSGTTSFAQTIVINDSNTTVNLPPGIGPGGTISFAGDVIVSGARAVEFAGTPPGVTLSFGAGTTTSSDSNEAFFTNDPFSGSFNNAGTVSSDSSIAILFDEGFTGTFTNSGTVNAAGDGIQFDDERFTGTFIQSGSITAGGEGILFDDGFTGTFTNSGTVNAARSGIEVDSDRFNGTFIQSGSITAEEEGILFDAGFTGTFINSGTITSLDNPGVFVDDESFIGTFRNSGSIFGDEEAVVFSNGFEGTFINTGTIRSGSDGILIDDDGFIGNLLNSGTIEAESRGIIFDSDFEGTLTNTGTIRAGAEGLDFVRDFDGTFMNSGTILSTEDDGIQFGDSFGATSSFTNSGTIIGAFQGINAQNNVGGMWLNTGIIEGQDGFGLAISETQPGTLTFTNRGGRVTGTMGSIQLGSDNGTVILEGPSHIQGTMFGGTGAGDTLRFQNIRGINDAKRAELAALVGADPTQTTTINLFGEDISFTEFESIQVELASLQSYEDLLRPGLGNYGTALDNVIQLNDEIREFLSALNDADLDTLNKIAGTTSGQVIVSGLDDFVQHQDTNLFSLFMNEFSTLRGDPSGGGSLAANERNGLFTREIQVGVTINEPMVDTTHAYVTGYVGDGTQDPDLTRSESSIDNTSILFGFSNHVSNEWMLGLWGGYVDNEATVDSFGSYLKNEVGYVGVNANYLSDDLFANVLLGYGFHDQLSTRRDFQGSVFDGDAVGNQGLLQAQAGRDYYFGDAQGAKISPYLGFTLSALSMGGFTEDGPALTRLRFEGETTVSAQSVLGVNVSGYKETGSGWIKPKFDAAWWHEFAGADDYGVALATPGFLNAFQVTSPVANRDRAVVQVGLEFGLDKWEGVSFDATYFGTVGEDGYSSHGGALSATFEF